MIKFIWSATDITAGMIVCRAHRQKSKWFAEGWRAKWTSKIGYVPGDGKKKRGGHYCQIAMTDGLVYHRNLTKEQMAKVLTDEDMVPMPWTWWLQMTRYLRTQTAPEL